MSQLPKCHVCKQDCWPQEGSYGPEGFICDECENCPDVEIETPRTQAEQREQQGE